MPLSPYLAQLLEAYEPERLQALVHWLESDASALNDTNPCQDEEVSPMNVTNVNASLSQIQAGSPAPLDDLIIFSILDEFGPQFMGRPCFQWLSQSVSQNVVAQASLS